MKDNEKLIIAFYIDVRGINKIDIPQYLDTVVQATQFDDTVRTFYIPIEGETHVDSLNPKYVTKKEYEQVVEKFNALIEKANQAFDIKNDKKE